MENQLDGVLFRALFGWFLFEVVLVRGGSVSKVREMRMLERGMRMKE